MHLWKVVAAIQLWYKGFTGGREGCRARIEADYVLTDEDKDLTCKARSLRKLYQWCQDVRG